MELVIKREEDLENAAKGLLNFAGPRRKMAFYGEVGAGKTTMIKILCRLLGVKEAVTSPTYALINQYQGQYHGVPCHINHLDLYRLKNLEEALEIGIEDLLYDDSFCFVEWPELIEAVLPYNIVRIQIKFIKNSSRKILFL